MGRQSNRSEIETPAPIHCELCSFFARFVVPAFSSENTQRKKKNKEVTA
jgi:hypothetical protein